MNRKRIIYVGQFKFPTGEAASFRTLNIANVLDEIGYEVLFCTGQLSQFQMATDNSNLPFETHYINYSNSPISKLSKAVKYLASGYRTVKWLQSLSPRPDVVILYGGYSIYASHLLPWSKRFNIPLIADVVEWYQPSHLIGGPLGPFRWSFEIALRHYFPKFGNIIAISKYLENYYLKKGCAVIRMPPTLSTTDICCRTAPSISENRLILAYAGVPGKKDLLNNIIEALMQLDPDGQKIHLITVGPDAKTILRLPIFQHWSSHSLPNCIQALGRLSHEKALDVVRAADFSVLLRSQKRYAQAGFPTKVPESFAVGTPVICNLTSDLGEYITDGQEGLVCKSYSVDDFKTTLKRALLLTPEQKRAMRHAARRQAEKSFDFRNYSNSLNAFIQQAMLK